MVLGALIVNSFLYGLLSSSAATPSGGIETFPPALASYPSPQGASIGEVLKVRIQADPFNLVATVIFFLAIVHTFSHQHFFGGHTDCKRNIKRR